MTHSFPMSIFHALNLGPIHPTISFWAFKPVHTENDKNTYFPYNPQFIMVIYAQLSWVELSSVSLFSIPGQCNCRKSLSKCKFIKSLCNFLECTLITTQVNIAHISIHLVLKRKYKLTLSHVSAKLFYAIDHHSWKRVDSTLF